MRSVFEVLRRNAGISTFIMVWSAGVLIGSCRVGAGVVHQARTLQYAQTSGRVLRSELVEHAGGDGTSYAFAVAYRYEVAGRAYEGDVWRHDAYASSEHAYYRALLARYAPGAVVPVYFDRDQPQRAVLVRGDVAASLFLAVFLSPFLYSVLLMGWLASRSLRVQCGQPEAGGLPYERQASTLRLQIVDQFSLLPGAVGCGAAVIIALLDMVFVRPHGPWPGHVAALGLQVIAAIATRIAFRGRRTLVVDSAAGALTRSSSDRAERWDCRFEQVRGLWVEERTRGAHVGDAVHRYALMLAARMPRGTERFEIGEFSSLPPALALRRFLERTISPRPPAGPPAASVRPAANRAADAAEPAYVVRRHAPREVAWLLIAGSSLFTLTLLAAALYGLVRIAFDLFVVDDWWLLFAGALGVLSVPAWRKCLRHIHPFERVLYADRSGIGWDLEHRGTQLPRPAQIGPTQGYVEFAGLSAIADERGRAHDQIELRLKQGGKALIPHQAATDGSRKALLRWLEREVPQLPIERPRVRILEGDAPA